MKRFFTGRSHPSEPAALPATQTETKAQPLVAVELARRACFTAPDFAALCREGFARNPVVYRCVRMIAEACASVPLVTDGETTLPSDTPEALERFYGYLQVAGCAYVEAVLIGDDLVGIRTLRPDTVTPVKDRAGRHLGFEVETESGRTVHRRDPLTGRCAVMRLALFNPLDEGSGQSPLRAASTSVDLHNQGTRWAKSLLDNSARPSGALVFDGTNGRSLTREQVDKLKAELEQGFSGPAHAGRPMVLEGGLDWKTMGMSPSDMDFTQGRREAARDIALAFGVPPMLLGIPGDNTYANYAEANRAFWRQTVVPLVARTARALSAWVSAFGEEAVFRPDLDAVPALSDERRAFAGLPPRGTVQ